MARTNVNQPMQDDEQGWSAVTEDEGYSIDFPNLPSGTFFGTFKGVTVKQSPSLATGEIQDVSLMLFVDTEGERCSAWANYRLEEALKKGLAPGDEVKIVWHGKEKIKDGAQEINRMSVYVKSS